jgi:hypothetical protein
VGYYIRVLGKNPAQIPLQVLRGSALPALIDTDENGGDVWEQAVLKHESGQEIAVVERNPVMAGQLGAEEIQEFLDEVSLHRPESAAAWLRAYLPTVKVIYAFQLLSGTDVNDGWASLHRVYNTVWNAAGGILQADGEGFSNEEGFTTLWQFGERAAGAWNVGVLVDGSRWVHFEIDLGNQQHREAFWRGEVPPGAKIV